MCGGPEYLLDQLMATPGRVLTAITRRSQTLQALCQGHAGTKPSQEWLLLLHCSASRVSTLKCNTSILKAHTRSLTAATRCMTVVGELQGIIGKRSSAAELQADTVLAAQHQQPLLQTCPWGVGQLNSTHRCHTGALARLWAARMTCQRGI